MSAVGVGNAAIAGSWQCRACHAPVTVTAEAVETMARFNGILARSGGEPLDPDDAVFCDDCGVGFRQKRADAAARNALDVQRHIATLRDSQAPQHVIHEAEDFIERRANDGKAIVMHYATKRREGGTVAVGVLGIFSMIAIAVLGAAFAILALWALGAALLAPDDELAEARLRKVWREKRRELNASVEARRVRS